MARLPMMMEASSPVFAGRPCFLRTPGHSLAETRPASAKMPPANAPRDKIRGNAVRNDLVGVTAWPFPRLSPVADQMSRSNGPALLTAGSSDRGPRSKVSTRQMLAERSVEIL